MNKHDEILLQNLRCPHCGEPVKSVWNLKTTHSVVCSAKCDKGKFLMKPEDCTIDDENVEVEFLEEVE